MHPNTYTDRIKDLVRLDVFYSRLEERDEPAMSYVCFPARECLCVKKALELGAIDLNTDIIFFERDREDRKHILQTLRDLGFKHHIYANGDFHSGPIIRYWEEQIKTCSKRIPLLDLIWLDFCGELDSLSLFHISQIRPYMLPWCVFAVTFTAHTRAANIAKLNKDAAQHFLQCNTKHIELMRGKFSSSNTQDDTKRGIVARISECGFKLNKHINYRSTGKPTNMIVQIYKPV